MDGSQGAAQRWGRGDWRPREGRAPAGGAAGRLGIRAARQGDGGHGQRGPCLCGVSAVRLAAVGQMLPLEEARSSPVISYNCCEPTTTLKHNLN